MEKISYYIQTSFLLILGLISSLLSIKSRMKFGSVIGNLIRFISGNRNEITLNNLRNAFPEKHNNEIIEIYKGCFRNLGITMIETATMKYIKDYNFHKIIRFENIDLIRQILARGKGLIFISGHFGNWEYLAYSGGLFLQIGILIVVESQKNYILDNILNKYRTRGGNRIVSRYNAAKSLINQLKNNGTVAFLADQSATSDKDVFVDFFGHPAATYDAPAQLALKFNVPIIFGWNIRQSDGTYIVKLREIMTDDLTYSKESIIELTKRHVNILEDAIRENPDHWAWMHRRWKHKPYKSAE